MGCIQLTQDRAFVNAVPNFWEISWPAESLSASQDVCSFQKLVKCRVINLTESSNATKYQVSVSFGDVCCIRKNAELPAAACRT